MDLSFRNLAGENLSDSLNNTVCLFELSLAKSMSIFGKATS
jgi:hypothetical protein